MTLCFIDIEYVNVINLLKSVTYCFGLHYRGILRFYYPRELNYATITVVKVSKEWVKNHDNK